MSDSAVITQEAGCNTSPPDNNNNDTSDTSNENEDIQKEKGDESAGSFPIGLLMLGLLALARRR
jgi:MYXO-CTERM domain-containing protein